MNVVLMPVGRGNWATFTVTYEGAHMAPLDVKVGDVWVFGTLRVRVCGVFDS